jgi:CubicO group peptidase (beta-lactamase class C family)
MVSQANPMARCLDRTPAANSTSRRHSHRITPVTAVAILLAIVTPQAWSKQGGRPPQWNALIGMFDPTLAEDHIVGASVALVERGRIVARHDYGFADREGHTPVDGQTIFHWASITKTLNAISVMQLRDQGLLKLDDRIASFVPELRRVHDPYGSIDDITIRMLMTHSAGFQAKTWPYKQDLDWEPFEPTSWEQLVAMMPYQEVQFRPGSQFSYSNPAWLYLARTLELLTGDAWENYVQKNIFAPLGMSQSYFGATPKYLRSHRSHGYILRTGKDGKPETIDEGGDFDPGITIPNGGWNSPLTDAAAYIAFLTNAVNDQNEKRRYDAVLRRSTLEEMLTPQLRVSADADAPQMGLGFFLISRGPHRIVGHTGSQAGFMSFLYFDQDTGRGIIAAFNTTVLVEGDFDRHSFSKLREQALKVLTDAP